MMKANFPSKVLKQATLVFLISSPSWVFASKYVDRNYFTRRPINENLPVAITINNTFFNHNNPILKGTLQASPFVEFSTNKSDLSDYFLYSNGSDSLSVGLNQDIDHRYFKFNEQSATNLTGNLSINPKVTTYGVYLAYNQPLDTISKDLLLRVNLPIVQVRANPNLKVTNNVESSEASKSISDYFQGEVMFQGVDATQYKSTRIMQEALEYGKISKSSVHKTSVADINLELNYQMLKAGNFFLNVNALLGIPTNSPPRAQWLLEPTIGTAGHWGIGLGVDGSYKFDDCFQLIYDVRYKYLTSANERRILGLKDLNGNKLKLGQYMLFGVVGAPRVTPAANQLAQRVSVHPHGRLELLTMLSCNKNNFLGHVGYNLWYKQKDSVKKVRYWENESFALASSDYLPEVLKILDADVAVRKEADYKVDYSNVNNTIAKLNTTGTTGTIKESQLDTQVAESPSVITHKLFASAGYSWDKPSYSYYLGAGGALEFPDNNAALQNVDIWLKAGLVF